MKCGISLYGPIRISWSDTGRIRGLGAKHLALIALLAASPNMLRTRTWLIDKLWGRSDQRLGRSSLRQALTTIRQTLGHRFDDLFLVEADQIGLNTELVEIEGGPELGEFLEGFDIAEEGFEDWLREQRLSAPDVRPAKPLPRKEAAATEEEVMPVLAVLPFTFYGEGGAWDGLGDFFAQEITRMLSRSQLINLISHLSSRKIDAREIDLEEIRGKLNTNFVVAGSIRDVGGRLMVHVDCLDSTSGAQLWTERFLVPEGAVFDPNSGLVAEVAAEIIRTLLMSAAELSAGRPLPDLPAHRLLMSAVSLMYRISELEFKAANDRLRELEDRAPLHSVPQAWAAQWRLLRIYQGWSDDPAADRAEANAHLKKGLDLNPSCSLCLAMDGNVKTVLESDFQAAAQRFASAIAANHNSALTCTFKSVLHTFKGEAEDAVQMAERSMLLSPLDPRKHFFDALHASAFLVGGRYDEAVALADASLKLSPHHISAHRSKVVGLSLAERTDEAREAAADLLRLVPDMTISEYLKNHPARDTGVAEFFANAMGDAGIPFS